MNVDATANLDVAKALPGAFETLPRIRQLDAVAEFQVNVSALRRKRDDDIAWVGAGSIMDGAPPQVDLFGYRRHDVLHQGPQLLNERSHFRS